MKKPIKTADNIDYISHFSQDLYSTTTVFPTALEMVLHWSVNRGNEPFLHQPVNGEIYSWTWAEATDEARRVAAFLQDHGLMPGDHGAICSVNSAHWIMTDIAMQMAGITIAPAFTTMDSKNFNHVMDLSEAKVLFVGASENTDMLDLETSEDVIVVGLPGNTSVRCQYLWNDIVSDTDPIADIAVPDAESIYSLVFTSGSTGVPKGVMISHRAYRSIGVNLVRYIRSTSDDVLLSFLPLAHMAERAIVLAQAYFTGCQVYFNESLETFATDIVRTRPTVFFAVPRLWEKFAQGVSAKFGGQKATIAAIENPDTGEAVAAQVREALGFSRARLLITGSAPTSPALHLFFEAIGLPLYDMYGQSELLTGSANIPSARKVGTIGRPFLNTEMQVDPDTGELRMRSESAMSGYYKQDDKTAETLVDGWVYTGDKAVFDEDGYIKLVGRVKEIFKTSRGKYVAPAPVEAKFAESPYLEQLCLIGSGRANPILLATLSPVGLETNRIELIEKLDSLLKNVNSTLAAHEFVSHLVATKNPWTIENGLLTHTMKIKRDVIEKAFSQVIDTLLDSEGPGAYLADGH